ncbi:hypothetical protein [Bradyrhizobium sp. 2TAF24]|uniref:hypothetical protein n=1 Tax=Bradyrhizobium sp. 2TAF24 TaxID=3233011 RepID=UPI003F8D9F33
MGAGKRWICQLSAKTVTWKAFQSRRRAARRFGSENAETHKKCRQFSQAGSQALPGDCRNRKNCAESCLSRAIRVMKSAKKAAMRRMSRGEDEKGQHA